MGSNRNAPCPCGSGRKYKTCCLTREREADDRLRRAEREHARLLAVIEGAEDALMTWITETTGVHPLDLLDAPAEPSAALREAQLLFHGGEDDRESWLEAFLSTDPPLTAAGRRWLEAQRDAWIGLWEILEVWPGQGIRVRCRLTGETRDVTEYTIGPEIEPHTHLVGRAVAFDEMVLMCGVHRRMLPKASADVLLDTLRDELHTIARLPRRRLLRPEELRRPRAQGVWQLLLGAMLDGPEPDGVELLEGASEVVSERFAFDGARDAIAAAIRGLDGVEEDAGGDGVETFWLQHAEVEGDAWSVGSARLELHAEALVAHTMSPVLADAVRARLEAIGLRAVAREVHDLDALWGEAVDEAAAWVDDG